MKSPNDQFLHLYRSAKKWDVINDDDPDLIPIYFTLPPAPPFELIDGFGLYPDEQFFHRVEVPRKLRELEDKALNSLYEIEKGNRQDTIQGYKLYLKYWELFEAEEEHLEKEIEWLRKVWWHRINGYWFYNDGEPTFIPPEMYDFLNFYYIAESKTYPEYRDDVRRKFLFSWYLQNATETFADIEPETGRAQKVDGKYKMFDLQRRVFFGDIEPKTRRTGATHESIHNLLVGTITHESFFSTILSLEGDNAKKHYEQKLLPAWDAYPMCLKPIWEGNRRPTTLKLSAPPNVYHVKGLNSAIGFTDSAGEKKSEGKRINRILSDESGKTEASDIAERWHVNKYCMSTGMGVNIIEGAYCKNPSTVEEMDAGGAPYFKLCMLSDFYKRVPSLGQTNEGFARIFLPAYLRLEGYIDRFGKSVIEKPTERQKLLSPHAVFTLSNKGAKEMLQEQRDALLRENTPQAMEAYRSLRRKSPFTWAECWLGSSGNVGFNLEIIDKRLGEINRMKSFGKTPYKTGYFFREKGGLDDRVLWQTDVDNPKFRMSMDIPAQMTNQRTATEIVNPLNGKLMRAWLPINGHKFTCGVDMFRNLKATDSKIAAKYSGSGSNSRQSNGGIAILQEYDPAVDKDSDQKQWKTYRCVLSYNYRPSTQMEFMEDVLMAAQYFGAMIYPEQNVERFIEHTYDRNMGGYFLYDTELATGRLKSLPGRYTTNDVLQDMFRDAKDYIEFRAHAEDHDDLLNEWKNIRGLESATHHDLFVAFGMALLGSKSRYRQLMQDFDKEATFDLDGWGFKKRAY
jgi:hypothetical protein